MRQNYLDTILLIERLHRRLYDLIQDAFDRLGWDDLNPAQALMLFNLGKNEVSAGELRSMGYYLGSNFSYNMKKLSEGSCIFREQSATDRRSVRVRLTPKGEEVAEVVGDLYDGHLRSLEAVGGINASSLEEMSRSLQRLDRFWVDQQHNRIAG